MHIRTKILLSVLFGLFIFSFIYCTSTDLNQDLGRHLKIGEIIVTTGTIPDTNYFSYTHPNFDFINHHWLSEVIFYLAVQWFGLSALFLIKIICFFTAIGFCVYTARNRVGLIPSLIIGTFFLPLLLERQFIRPELFGYAFFSILLYLLFKKRSNNNHFFALPFIMVLWANIHITYVFGLFLLLLFGIKILAQQKNNTRWKMHLLIIGLSFVSTIINPNGIAGALYPLFIFSNYGYSIVENQNLFFLKQILLNPIITYYFFLSPFVVISIVWLFIRKHTIEAVVISVFFFATVFQIRHMPFFVFSAISIVPLILTDLKHYIKKLPVSYRYALLSIYILGLLIVIFLFATNWYARTFDNGRYFGGHFSEEARPAIEFVKRNKLDTHIFNNFDIGGYLIYTLYPEYQVFIDNRPEAYPGSFIQNDYIALQNDPKLRKALFKLYAIHTVFFSHSDQTPWAKNFIRQMNDDLSWKLVYFDSSVIIFTDTGTLPDRRNDIRYFSSVIDMQSDYLELLKLTNILTSLGQNKLAEKAFEKARIMNPHSCSINKYVYRSYENTLYFIQAQDIKNRYWFCF